MNLKDNIKAISLMVKNMDKDTIKPKTVLNIKELTSKVSDKERE